MKPANGFRLKSFKPARWRANVLKSCAVARPQPQPGSASTSAGAVASPRQSMVDMGFSSADITAALRRSDFAFGQALLLLPNGLDEHRTNIDRQQSERFRCHVLQKVLTPKDEGALIGSSVFSQYKQRMFESFKCFVAAWDLGHYALLVLAFR